MPSGAAIAAPATSTLNSRVCCRVGMRPRASGDKGRVDLGHDHTGLVVGLGEDAAPGIDDDGMPEGLAPILMASGLRGRHHERARFDGAGAVQHRPNAPRRSGG